MLKKKILSLLLCATMSVTLLAGCGDSAQSSDNEDAVENTEDVQAETGNENQEETKTIDLRAYEGTTITLAHSQGEYTYEYFYRWCEAFYDLTGITVEVIEVPSSDWNTWTAAQITAGTQPDILFNKAGVSDDSVYADLTKYYDYVNPFNDTVWKDCFVEGSIRNCVASDGETYIGTAVQATRHYLYYNKTIMEELGLGTEAPKTVSEMLEMMKVCAEDGRYIPMNAMNSSLWNFGNVLRYYGNQIFYGSEEIEKLDIITPNGVLDTSEALLGWKTGVLTLENPRFVELFSLMKEMSQYCNEDFNTASWEHEALFNEGKAMFNINGSWFPGQFVVTGAELDYGVADFPLFDTEYSSEYGLTEAPGWINPEGEAMFFITKKCEDEGRMEAAVLFDMFMTDYNTGAQMYVDDIMQPSPVLNVTYPELISDFGNIEYGEAIPSDVRRVVFFNTEVQSTYFEVFHEFMDKSSTQSAEEMAKEATEEITKLIDDIVEEYTAHDILSYVDQVK